MSLDGRQGPAARAVLDEVGKLKWLARPERVAVDTYDERFSTVIAEQNLKEAKVRKGKRRSHGRRRCGHRHPPVVARGERLSIDTETELSAPDDTVDRRTARARQRRRSFLALGIIAALVLPFLFVGGWFVWELNPPGDAGAARGGGDPTGMGREGGG